MGMSPEKITDDRVTISRMEVAPDNGLIPSHVKCIACGYDLFATSRIGRCPECGGSVARSIELADFFGAPNAIALARWMGTSLLISSIFAGLCPAVCLLALNAENFISTVAMTVIFSTCVVSGAIAEYSRRRITAMGKSHDGGETSILPDVLAASGLVLINLSAFVYACRRHRGFTGTPDYEQLELISLWCVACGFFLLCITAWRAVPTWLAHADIARIANAPRLAGLLTFLAWTKAIYETIWLACCWTPFAIFGLHKTISIDDGLAILPAYGAALGLIGFAVIWILMIIAHSILLVQIRRRTSIESTMPLTSSPAPAAREKTI